MPAETHQHRVRLSAADVSELFAAGRSPRTTAAQLATDHPATDHPEGR